MTFEELWLSQHGGSLSDFECDAARIAREVAKEICEERLREWTIKEILEREG